MQAAIRRAFLSLATLFVIACATFTIMHTVPGGPFSRERALPPEIEANIARKYNLDQPLHRQFARYLGGLLRGDLGPSFVHEGRSVNQIIKEGFPKSATLGGTGFLVAFGIGVPFGVVAAIRRRGIVDRGLMLLAVLGVSVPSFIIASLLQYLFSKQTTVFGRELGPWPTAGWGDSPWQVVLPALAMAGFPLAFVSRLVRTSMMNVLDADYLRTARAKGVGRLRVLVRHGLRNAIMPAVTYSGPLLASLLTGSFVVESIFAIPGLGSAFVTSISDRDYTVIMGVTLFYSALLVSFNILVDVLYLWLDPRVGSGS